MFVTLGNLAAQNRESRIARFPESRARNRQKFHSEKQKSELNRSRIAENRFRIAIRIAAYIYIYIYQCLRRPWNCTIRIARFRIARFPIQNRRFSATPDLLFLAVLENKENPQKQQGFVLAGEPLKSLENKQKTRKKARISLKRKKQGNPKRQGKEDQGAGFGA